MQVHACLLSWAQCTKANSIRMSERFNAWRLDILFEETISLGIASHSVITHILVRTNFARSAPKSTSKATELHLESSIPTLLLTSLGDILPTTNAKQLQQGQWAGASRGTNHSCVFIAQVFLKMQLFHDVCYAKIQTYSKKASRIGKDTNLWWSPWRRKIAVSLPLQTK
jgi:hypothetical protein